MSQPFLKLTNQLTVEAVNALTFGRAGHRMIQRAVETVNQQEKQLWVLFFDAATTRVQQLKQFPSKHLLTTFFKEWLKKLIHARTREALTVLTTVQKENSGKRAKFSKICTHITSPYMQQLVLS